ncbi:hypothetical protein ACKFKF_19245 [Phormidesmis sp. 146-12]
MSAPHLSRTRSQSHIQQAQSFKEQFNRSSFMFSHNLVGNPLFELPRLVKLANTLIEDGPGTIRCQVNDVPIHLKWMDATLKEQFQEQLPEYIANIEQSESWLLLYSVQRDPEYAALLNQLVDELELLTGEPLRQEMTWLDAYIFIASPHSITPYHIDHESTFLFQIRGDRASNLFDQRDRSILTEQELENFYIGDQGAANYNADNQVHAKVYPLAPGTGVHHPVCAPHWYKNGDHYSVAMGVHFGLRSFDLSARVYQVNHYLRKLGLNPTPPGQSPLLDSFKIQTLGLFSKRKPSNKDEVLRSGINRIVSGVKPIATSVKSVLKVF